MSLLPLMEKTSALYRATLLDEFGALVPASALLTLTLTLYDRATGTAINGRTAQSVLGASGVAVNGVTTYNALQTDSDGVTYNLKWDLAPADNPIITDSLSQETHVALFQATWATGGVNHEVALPVRNIAKVA